VHVKSDLVMPKVRTESKDLYGIKNGQFVLRLDNGKGRN
jgi:hypothetical protein